MGSKLRQNRIPRFGIIARFGIGSLSSPSTRLRYSLYFLLQTMKQANSKLVSKPRSSSHSRRLCIFPAKVTGLLL